MKKFWLVSAAVVALSVSAFGDTVSFGTGIANVVPSTWTTPAFTGSNISTNTQVPFWNNPSADTIASHIANVGDVLAGLTTGTNMLGSNLVGGVIQGSYYAFTSTDNTAGGGDPTTGVTTTVGGTTAATPGLEFSFLSNLTSYNISVLFADSANNGPSASQLPTAFGWYSGTPFGTGANAFTAHQIGGGINNNTTGVASALATTTISQNGFAYGLYATVCLQVVAGNCTGSVTYTTGAGNFTTNLSSSDARLGSLGWNHFALFQLANGGYALGFEDSPWGPASGLANEGIGDFNDIVIGLNAFGTTATPEPGTMGVMGLGLAGLAFAARKRFAKK